MESLNIRKLIPHVQNRLGKGGVVSQIVEPHTTVVLHADFPGRSRVCIGEQEGELTDYSTQIRLIDDTVSSCQWLTVTSPAQGEYFILWLYGAATLKRRFLVISDGSPRAYGYRDKTQRRSLQYQQRTRMTSYGISPVDLGIIFREFEEKFMVDAFLLARAAVLSGYSTYQEARDQLHTLLTLPSDQLAQKLNGYGTGYEPLDQYGSQEFVQIVRDAIRFLDHPRTKDYVTKSSLGSGDRQFDLLLKTLRDMPRQQLRHRRRK